LLKNILFAEIKQLHDETLHQTQNWFEGSTENIRSGITAHYGNLPEAEQAFWTLPNGPTWSWWLLAILPIDLQLKVSTKNSAKLM
jgi:hypothetical protein